MNEPDFHLRISSKKTYYIFDVRRDNVDQGYTPCDIIVLIHNLYVGYRNSASLFDFRRTRLHA